MLISGGDESFFWGEGVGGGRIKLHDSTWERTFPDEGDEKILG